MSDTDNGARPGSTADLSRRVDRLEGNLADLSKEVAGLTSTVARVEQNQVHAEELNKLRFSSLDTAVTNVAGKLDAFMARVESIITGEVQLPQAKAWETRQAEEERWREKVDERLDGHDTFETQGRLIGRLVVLLVGANAAAIIAAIYAIVKP